MTEDALLKPPRRKDARNCSSGTLNIKVVVDLASCSFCISSDSGCLEGAVPKRSFPETIQGIQLLRETQPEARIGKDRALLRTVCSQRALERSRTMQNRKRSPICRQTNFGINSGEDAPAIHTDFNHVTEADWQSVVNELRTLRETFSRLLSLSDSLGKILEVSKIEKRLRLERDRRILEMSKAGTPVRDIAGFVDITAAQVAAIVERMGRMVKRHQNN